MNECKILKADIPYLVGWALTEAKQSISLKHSHVDSIVDIRETTLGDIPDVVDIWRDSMELYRRTNPNYWKLSKKGEKAFCNHVAETLSKPDASVIVAEENGTLVGFTLVYVESLPEWFETQQIGLIRYMAVSSVARGKKVGAMMFDFAIKWFRERRVNRVELYVLNGLPASGFWQKLGFSTFMERRFLEL